MQRRVDLRQDVAGHGRERQRARRRQVEAAVGALGEHLEQRDRGDDQRHLERELRPAPRPAADGRHRSPRQRRESSARNVNARKGTANSTRSLTARGAVPPRTNAGTRSNSGNGRRSSGPASPPPASFQVMTQKKGSTPYVAAPATSWLSVRAERKSPQAAKAAARRSSPK